MTPNDLVTVFTDRIATGQAVVDTEKAHTAAVKADRDKRAQTRRKVFAFKHLLIAMFLESPDVLGDFGLAPPKPAQKSAAVKAGAAAKGMATREKLGTKGPRQKKAALAASGAPVAAPAQPGAAGGEPAATAAQPPVPAAVPAPPAKPVS